MRKERILIVEEQQVSEVLRPHLVDREYEVATANTCALAEEAWRKDRPDLVVLNANLPDVLISRLVPRLQATDAFMPVIVLANHASLALATEALRLGAEQFLVRPVEPAFLGMVIERSLEKRRNQRLRLAEASNCDLRALDPFLGRSDAVKALQDLAPRIASMDGPVLIQGETGAGKRTLARWLHQNSPRSSEPCVELNCASSRALLEADMFGDERPPSSVSPGKPPALEIAHRGTLFLRAIDNLDPLMQPKLLRLLGRKQFRRLGSGQERRVDIRLMGGTHRPLGWLLRQRQFRDQASFRIRTISITLPPLRQRVEDIPALAGCILSRLAADSGSATFELSRIALSALQGYSWPGNIRELSIVLERAVLVANDSVLTERDLGFDLLSEQNLSGAGHHKTLEEFERHYIRQILRKEGGHVESAARKLGMPRSSLYQKLRQYREDQPA